MPLSSVAEMLPELRNEPLNTRLILRLAIALNGMAKDEPWITVAGLKGAMLRLIDVIERLETPIPVGTGCPISEKEEIASPAPAPATCG